MSTDTDGALRGIELSYEQAEDVLHAVTANRIRWGRLYDAGDIGVAKLCDALVVIAHGENRVEKELRTSLTLANRQLAAAGAREGKLKKRLAELTGKPFEEPEDEPVVLLVNSNSVF